MSLFGWCGVLCVLRQLWFVISSECVLYSFYVMWVCGVVVVWWIVRLKFFCVSECRWFDRLSLICMFGCWCRKLGRCGMICWWLSVIGVVMCSSLCGLLVRFFMCVKCWLIDLNVLCVLLMSVWFVLVSCMLCVVWCMSGMLVVFLRLVMCWFIVVLLMLSCCVVVVKLLVVVSIVSEWICGQSVWIFC